MPLPQAAAAGEGSPACCCPLLHFRVHQGALLTVFCTALPAPRVPQAPGQKQYMYAQGTYVCYSDVGSCRLSRSMLVLGGRQMLPRMTGMCKLWQLLRLL